jgi:hypothetical protein
VADTVNWNGTGFSVHTINVTWAEVPGVYIFAGVISGSWRAIYIGQCDSFKGRCPLHERWAEARQLGASHVHAKTVRDPAERDHSEETLIHTFQPPLNTHHR